MIEIEYQKLSHQGFLNALSHLASQRLNVKAAYNVKKLADAVMKARKEVGEEYMKFMETYFTRDEKGEIILEEGQPQIDDSTPEKKEAFMKAQDEFGKNVKKIERNKLIFGVDLTGDLALSAAEISVLDPILAELEQLAPPPVIPFHKEKASGPQPA